MDLSILVLDGDIYRLRDSKIGEFSVTLHSLKLPKELKVSQSARPPRCLVDPSNSYVAYYTRKREWGNGPSRPDVLAFFRIYSDETSSPRLQPSLPQDIFDISSQFHPSAPLVIVGFRLISEAGALESDKDYSPVHVIIIDMNTMSKRAVKIEQNPDFRVLLRHWWSYHEIGAAFSNSGAFAYITGPGYGHQIIDCDIEVSPKSYRYMELVLAIDGAFYELHDSGEGSIVLSLSKPEPTRWGVARHSVNLSNLVFLSSSYANRVRAFLILGKTDEDQMHVLLVPNDDCAPELKSAPLTWAEARAILDRKWEKEHGRPL